LRPRIRVEDVLFRCDAKSGKPRKDDVRARVGIAFAYLRSINFSVGYTPGTGLRAA